MHTENTLKSNQTKKNVKLTYTQKQKNGATHAVKYWLNPVQHLFQAFNSLLRSSTSSSSLYFQSRIALRLLMLIFPN